LLQKNLLDGIIIKWFKIQVITYFTVSSVDYLGPLTLQHNIITVQILM